MGHGKETPRQKMIGMMYLVLTALLALNVQKEVLDAFINVDEGLHKTILTFDGRNEVIYADFREKAELNPSKVGPIENLALEVKEKADHIFEMIQELKIEIVELSEGAGSPAIDEHKHVHVDLINGKDNMDKPAEIMITKGKGTELKKEIEEFREWLIHDVIDEEKNHELAESIHNSLHTEDHQGHDGQMHPWESANFEHLPLAGVIAIMSGIQTDIRNVESEMISFLHKQIDAGTIKFTGLDATVIPNSNYILKGGQYRSEIFLAAFDTTQEPKIYIGKVDSTLDEESGKYIYSVPNPADSVIVKQGKGIYTQPANSVGQKSYEGVIELPTLEGVPIVRKFKHSYQVSEGSYSVNPLKMNVFYTGVDNPVDILVAGVPIENVSATITNGRIRRQPDGTWIVNPVNIGNAFVEVFAEIEGKKQSQGFKEFRVKQVPDPVAKVNNQKGGAINKSLLLVQVGVAAEMENFDFELEYKVTQFTVSAVIKGFNQEVPVKGNRFSQKQKDLINNLSRGDKVYIEDVKAVGPDGIERQLNQLIFRLN